MDESRNQSGFTLTEALIAVAILASMAVAMLPALRGAMMSHARTVAVIHEREAHVAVDEVLRDILLHAHSLPRADGQAGFSGTANSLQIVTQPPGFEGPLFANLTLENGNLVINFSSIVGRYSFMRPVVLAEDLNETRLFYFGESENRTGLEWRDNWDFSHPPRLVALDMSLDDGQIRRLEMRVGGNGSFDCSFDSGLGRCLVQEVQPSAGEILDTQPQDGQVQRQRRVQETAEAVECRDTTGQGRC